MSLKYYSQFSSTHVRLDFFLNMLRSLRLPHFDLLATLLCASQLRRNHEIDRLETIHREKMSRG